MNDELKKEIVDLKKERDDLKKQLKEAKLTIGEKDYEILLLKDKLKKTNSYFNHRISTISGLYLFR